MNDYGIKYPCYGEYNCPKCRRHWWSNQAWRDDGQECIRCEITLIPDKIEPLYYFVCANDECCFQWNNKKVELSRCKKCGSPGIMFETPKERHQYLRANNLEHTKGWDNENIKKETGHLNKLCERCQKSKYKDCKRQAMEDRATENALLRQKAVSYRRRSPQQQGARSPPTRYQPETADYYFDAREVEPEYPCCFIL